MAAGTQPQFIARVIAVHGDRYDLSRIRYIDGKSRVTAICRDHGPFLIVAQYFSRGGGCPACVAERKRAAEALKPSRPIREPTIQPPRPVPRIRLDTTAAVRELRHHRPNLRAVDIAYRLGISRERVRQILVSLGLPTQIARPVVVRVPARVYPPVTQEIFLKRVYRAHGDRYDMSAAQYVNSTTKVRVGCVEHGPFKTLPSSLWRGYGCPECGIRQATLNRRRLAFPGIAEKIRFATIKRTGSN